jgi:hypothetical protein
MRDVCRVSQVWVRCGPGLSLNHHRPEPHGARRQVCAEGSVSGRADEGPAQPGSGPAGRPAVEEGAARAEARARAADQDGAAGRGGGRWWAWGQRAREAAATGSPGSNPGPSPVTVQSMTGALVDRCEVLAYGT